MLSITFAPGLAVGVGRAPVAARPSSPWPQAPDVMVAKALETPANKIQAEYLWIDAIGEVLEGADDRDEAGGVKVSTSRLNHDARRPTRRRARTRRC